MTLELLDYLVNMPDWQRLVWVVTCLTFCWFLEALIPLIAFNYQKLKHIGVNMVFTTTSGIVNGLIAMLTVPIFLWVEANQFGVLYLFELPLWLELLIAFMMLDLIVQYGAHFLLHHVKWMWRFHLVHHSDTHVDASTGTRHHPGDIAIREVAVIFAVVIFGIPFEFYLFYRMTTIFFAYFTHANLQLPSSLDRWLSFILVTPDMHKFHHHFEAPWTDSNFGNIFSFWDRIFGTLVYEKTTDIQYGLDVLDPETYQDIGYQYALPFNAKVNTKNRSSVFSAPT